jgi:hypothetical protein
MAQLPTVYSFPRYGDIVRKAFLRRLDEKRIASLISAQYELFVEKSGRWPDFIDGHLHVHQLPGVREKILEFVLSLPVKLRPYVRNTQMPLREIWNKKLPWSKAVVIGAFGRLMRTKLLAAGAATNDGFAGIYDFRNWRRFPSYFPKFAACLPQPNGILVVHPGKAEDWRRSEFEVLKQMTELPNRFQQEF